MKLNKPNFWSEKNSVFSLILFPLTLFVLLFIFLKKKFTKSIKFNIPIVCVGNIYIGGTGKTPASIFLARKLAKMGKNPAIIRKYYASHIDEHDLIRKKFKNLILCSNRVRGIREAENKGFDTVILDDGFQDYKIKKDLNILCFHQKQLVGNGLVLPSGPLRNQMNSLEEVDVILINGKKDSKFENHILDINSNLEIFYSKYEPTNINQFKNKKLFAIAGIGNPNNFFNLIEDSGLHIEKKLIFPDHYKFSKKEIASIVKEAKIKNYKIIMTEKDFFKIKDLVINDIEYLIISLDIQEEKRFIKIINKIYD